MIIEISDEHTMALEAINSSYYQNDDLGETVEDMIEEHLIREHGWRCLRVGSVCCRSTKA